MNTLRHFIALTGSPICRNPGAWRYGRRVLFRYGIWKTCWKTLLSKLPLRKTSKKWLSPFIYTFPSLSSPNFTTTVVERSSRDDILIELYHCHVQGWCRRALKKATRSSLAEIRYSFTSDTYLTGIMTFASAWSWVISSGFYIPVMAKKRTGTKIFSLPVIFLRNLR